MDEVSKVVWTKIALKQRNSTFEYWNERNKSKNYSIKLNSKIKERITQLKSFPEIGIETVFPKTRVLYLGYYSILYQISPQYIIITGFWDNRQEPKKLLDFLKDNQK
jgi:ParE toxin of type II toxin-antitoxin system, parDE